MFLNEYNMYFHIVGAWIGILDVFNADTKPDTMIQQNC